MIDVLLWDNDGVLVDTEGLYFEATRAVLERVGLDLTPAHFRQLFLVEDRGAWHLAIERGVSETTVVQLRTERDERYAEAVANGRPLLPGVEQTLTTLAKTHRMAIVTSSHRNTFELIHAGNRLERFFELILCREDYGRSKPDPEPYLEAVRRLKTVAAHCLVIEDSVRGLTAAKAAGISCVVIPSGFTVGMSFEGAAAVLSSVVQVPAAAASL